MSGFSIACAYEFDSERDGRLDLGAAMYNALPASSEALLIPTDGYERRIRINLDAEPTTAAFRIID